MPNKSNNNKRGRTKRGRSNAINSPNVTMRSRSANKTAKRQRTSYNEPAVISYKNTGPMIVEGKNFYKTHNGPKVPTVAMSNAARNAFFKRMKKP